MLSSVSSFTVFILLPCKQSFPPCSLVISLICVSTCVRGTRNRLKWDLPGGRAERCYPELNNVIQRHYTSPHILMLRGDPETSWQVIQWHSRRWDNFSNRQTSKAFLAVALEIFATGWGPGFVRDVGGWMVPQFSQLQNITAPRHNIIWYPEQVSHWQLIELHIFWTNQVWHLFGESSLCLSFRDISWTESLLYYSHIGMLLKSACHSRA